MALITDATSSWSTPVTLATDEIWQARREGVFVTTTATPAADDGLFLAEGTAVLLPQGAAVRYRRAGRPAATIAREPV